MKQVKETQPITEKTKWRDDFPVDEVKAHYIERREFTKFMLLISGSFVIGQIYIGFHNIFLKKSSNYALKKITSIDSIEENGFISFEYPDKGDSCLLMRLSKTKFVAYSSKCTHLMCPVIPKMEEKKLYCPCHNGFFDLETGNVLAGPPPRALPRIKLKFINGDIYAEGMMS